MTKLPTFRRRVPSVFAARYRDVLCLACTLFLASACATSPEGPSAVEQRAQQRWDALIARDYDTAYSYLSPGYRSSVSRVDFEVGIRTRRVLWTSAKVESSECEGDACTVSTRVGYRVGSPVPGIPKWESTSLVHERWVRIDRAWWHVPD